MGQLALGLEQTLLERLHPAGALLEPPTQSVDLLLSLEEAGVQGLDLCAGLVLFKICRRTHLLRCQPLVTIPARVTVRGPCRRSWG